MARYRSIFVSDLHIGTHGFKADIFLDFLKNNESDYLYLVGDIIDFWRLKNKYHWPQSHNDVIQKILRKSRKGTNVKLITGNHDDFFRMLTPTNFGNIEIVDECEHITANNKRLMVIHGDAFDNITTHSKWIAILGDNAYTFLLFINRYFNYIRRLLGLDYWSLSSHLKQKIKKAASFISQYENSMIQECKRRGFDGVVSGHIHHPESRVIEDIHYYNCGDFVESCSFLAEDYNGNIEVIIWHKIGHN